MKDKYFFKVDSAFHSFLNFNYKIRFFHDLIIINILYLPMKKSYNRDFYVTRKDVKLNHRNCYTRNASSGQFCNYTILTTNLNLLLLNHSIGL